MGAIKVLEDFESKWWRRKNNNSNKKDCSILYLEAQLYRQIYPLCMCENGPRSVRRVCVYVSACVSGSILSLYFIPKPSPSSVALPLLPAPIFAGRASGPKNGFQTDPTISLSLPNRLSDKHLPAVCKCVRIFFFLYYSVFFFFIRIFPIFFLFLFHLFVRFRIYMATVWVGDGGWLSPFSHFAKSPDRSHAAAPQIQKQIQKIFFPNV